MSRYCESQTKLNARRPLPAIAGFRAGFIILIFSVLAVFGSFGSSVAQLYGVELDQANSKLSPFQVQASLDRASRLGRVGGVDLFDGDALQNFYEARQFEPYWMSNTGPYSRAHQFIEVLQRSWTHGLNPHSYHLSQIQSMVQGTDFVKKKALELLLSDAFVRYVRDLSGMRVDPKGLNVDPHSWQSMIKAREALSYLDQARPIGVILRSIEPQRQTYKALQRELIRLSAEPEEDFASVLPISFDGVLRPNERHTQVPNIRTRLGVSDASSDPQLYDDRLMSAVIRFQRKHGLVDDGIIGSSTLQIMNRTNKARIKQIIANLERLRWVNKGRAERYVVVNIPAATLWAIEQARVAFEMPVIVGKPARPTKSFVTNIQGVRFNPDWTIPPTIKRFDVLPKLRQDPGYLHAKGIELFDGRGRDAMSLDPLAVDWHNISNRELQSLRMVQMPGTNNPLGRVRLLMPNIYNIYLHDTNHPEYFDLYGRALSSGCIRMKYPEKMADFVLQSQPGWQTSNMQSIFETQKKTEVDVRETIPVYILYYTVWMDTDGRVVYGHDIYNEDSKLIKKLANIDGFHVPVHNEAVITVSGLQQSFSLNR